MQTIKSILASETTWTVLGYVLAYLANSVVSTRVAKLAPSSPWRRLVRALHGFFDKIDPAVLVVVLALPLLTACGGGQSATVPPSAYDVATAAVNVTDTALAAAISVAAPVPDADVEAWQKRLDALERAAAAIRARGDVCEALPGVASVATQIGCAECLRIVIAVERELSCSR